MAGPLTTASARPYFLSMTRVKNARVDWARRVARLNIGDFHWLLYTSDKVGWDATVGLYIISTTCSLMDAVLTNTTVHKEVTMTIMFLCIPIDVCIVIIKI